MIVTQRKPQTEIKLMSALEHYAISSSRAKSILYTLGVKTLLSCNTEYFLRFFFFFLSNETVIHSKKMLNVYIFNRRKENIQSIIFCISMIRTICERKAMYNQKPGTDCVSQARGNSKSSHTPSSN